MTTGEYMLSKSSLSSGTALAHLLAMQTGSGLGTVFASQFRVSIAQDEITVTRKAKRTIQEERPEVQSPRSPTPAKQEKNVAVFSATPRLAVFTAPDEITVTQRTAQVTITQRLPNETITRKRKAGLVSTALDTVFVKQQNISVT